MRVLTRIAKPPSCNVAGRRCQTMPSAVSPRHLSESPRLPWSALPRNDRYWTRPRNALPGRGRGLRCAVPGRAPIRASAARLPPGPHRPEAASSASTGLPLRRDRPKMITLIASSVSPPGSARFAMRGSVAPRQLIGGRNDRVVAPRSSGSCARSAAVSPYPLKPDPLAKVKGPLREVVVVHEVASPSPLYSPAGRSPPALPETGRARARGSWPPRNGWSRRRAGSGPTRSVA